ncbi:uncharacterized protein [Apostichopus japonicus]|uniref:uncharacterized protein n=1 Tax=Stichopus japonicus TaxID=307972 RepID=UPI003AB2ED27
MDLWCIGEDCTGGGGEGPVGWLPPWSRGLLRLPHGDGGLGLGQIWEQAVHCPYRRGSAAVAVADDGRGPSVVVAAPALPGQGRHHHLRGSTADGSVYRKTQGKLQDLVVTGQPVWEEN